MQKRHEQDPEWQAARGIAEGLTYTTGPTAILAARLAAAHKMYDIELAYEADPTLQPSRKLIELTPVCNHVRVNRRNKINRRVANIDKFVATYGPEYLEEARQRDRPEDGWGRGHQHARAMEEKLAQLHRERAKLLAELRTLGYDQF